MIHKYKKLVLILANKRIVGKTPETKKSVSPHLALVGELGGSDVQLLVLLLQFRKFSLQLGLVQLRIIQLGLYVLMVQLEVLIILQQLSTGSVQSEEGAYGLFSIDTCEMGFSKFIKTKCDSRKLCFKLLHCFFKY